MHEKISFLFLAVLPFLMFLFICELNINGCQKIYLCGMVKPVFNELQDFFSQELLKQYAYSCPGQCGSVVGASSVTKRLWIWFLVRAHTQVVSSSPARAQVRATPSQDAYDPRSSADSRSGCIQRQPISASDTSMSSTED